MKSARYDFFVYFWNFQKVYFYKQEAMAILGWKDPSEFGEKG